MMGIDFQNRIPRLLPGVGLAALLLFAAGCGRLDELRRQEAQKLEAEEAARTSLEEQVALAWEEARAAAEAREEALAQARATEESLEAARQEAAVAQALAAEREEQLRVQKTLLAEQARQREEQAQLSARLEELEAREQSLFEREREIEAREINVAVAEDELRAREGAAERPEEVSRSVEPDLPSETASLQPGRVFEIEILETLSSRTSRVGDTFPARLNQDLRAEDGTLVIPAGAEVVGEITEVTPLRKVGGRASLGIEFTRIIAPSGEAVEIRAGFSELGVDKRRDKKKIIGAAVAGAILGRVLGGKGGENAVLGAAVGAAAGTAAVARAQGRDAEIPAGEMVALQLQEVVTVEVEMTGAVNP